LNDVRMIGRVNSSVQEASETILLRIVDLRVVFNTYLGRIHALSGIDLDLHRGKITGLAGETGCGKSVTAKTIIQLLPKTAMVKTGSILLDGEEMLRKSPAEMKGIRGKTIAMIFQDPRAALNPLFTVEQQLYFLLHRHEHLDRKAARKRSLELLRAVGIDAPGRRIRNYPFELSTGMCQRVMIAMGLSCEPKLLIADEPTTGLDVTIQAQVLDLFRDLVYEVGSTAMLITHDLGVIAETCDYTGIMYAGRMVEFGATEDVIDCPLHPYTQGLLRSSFTGEDDDELHYIPGVVPDLLHPPAGCMFKARCGVCDKDCERAAPDMAEVANEHKVACFKAGTTQTMGQQREDVTVGRTDEASLS